MKKLLDDPGLVRDKALVNGEWLSADNNETLSVHDPATGALLAEVASCGESETRRAIEAAEAAYSTWKMKPAKERALLLRNLFDLINKNIEDLATLLTLEQGKPLAESRSEIIYGASYVEWFAEEAKRIYGDIIAPQSNSQRLVCIKQPVGVVACITPWNFPNAMLTRKIAPALAAGCTVVCKPASETPLSAFALGELANRAGIPPGVINILTGRTREIGAELMSNRTVRKLTFTGSTEIGKKLMAECASTVKRTSMELGGNAPFIVFDDADVDLAVDGAISSKYRNAGQTCVCANRFLVQDGVYQQFVEKLVERVLQIKLGSGMDDTTTMGPLIHNGAAESVMGLVRDAVKSGAQIAAGGDSGFQNPNFVKPTVLTDVDPDMRVFREEIFGPVAPVIRFQTEEEAISLANDTDVGLACYFYTRDLGRIWRVGEALEYGIVGINEGIISNEMAPFGGIKESGQGREGSKYGIDDYLEIKYMCMGNIG